MLTVWDDNGTWSLPINSAILKLIQSDKNDVQLNYDGVNNISTISFIKGIGQLFYIVDPNETMYNSVEKVPNIFRQAWPYFLLFIFLENVILWLERKPTLRLNDSLTSLSHGLFQECGRLLWRGGESYLYVRVFERYHLVDLPWDSPVTWYSAALAVDFCYYWLHRAGHEVHILWAQHQVHHSSEEFNLPVGLRQSILQGWCGFIFYLPMALFIPPAQFLTHQQFNLLYQFWIHTRAIKTLGPLEWVFNTPNHHRVHHGSNIYCLDKNYGGVLIIWDRLFGTFAEEQDEIIYGLVVQQPSYNPLHLQTFYTAYVCEKFKEMDNWRHKLATIFYGPSWMPGKPRLGAEEDKIDVTSRSKYDVKIPTWCNIYLLIHFVIVVYVFQILTFHYLNINPFLVLAFVLYILTSLTTIGMLFDNSINACIFEVVRCLIFFIFLQKSDMGTVYFSPLNVAMQLLFLFSAGFWMLQSLKILQFSVKTKKDQ